MPFPRGARFHFIVDEREILRVFPGGKDRLPPRGPAPGHGRRSRPQFFFSQNSLPMPIRMFGKTERNAVQLENVPLGDPLLFSKQG